MSFFLVLLIPLAYLFLKESVYSLQTAEAFNVYIKGLLSFIPVFLLVLLLRGIVPRIHSFTGSFFYFGYRDMLLWVIFSIGMFFLLKLNRDSYTEERLYFVSLSFFSGIYTPLAIIDLVTYAKNQNSYTLFMLPLMRLVVILLLPLLLSKAVIETRLIKFLYWFLNLLIIPALALIPAFYYTYHIVYAVLILAVLLCLAILLFILNYRDKLTWSFSK